MKVEVEIIQAHPLLELGDLLISQSVGLGNDGNKVDFGVQSAHKLNVQLLKPKVVYQNMSARWCVAKDLRVTCGLDEIQASVDAIVNNFCSIDTVLLLEI